MGRYCLNTLSAVTEDIKKRSLNEVSRRSVEIMKSFKHRVTGEAVEHNGAIIYEPDSSLLASSISCFFSNPVLGLSVFQQYGEQFERSASRIPALRNTDSSVKAILSEPYSWSYARMVTQEGVGRSTVGSIHKKTFNLLCNINCQSMVTSNTYQGLPRDIIPPGSYNTQSSDISAYNLIRVTPGIIKAFALWMNRKLDRTIGSPLRLYEVMSFDVVIPVLIDEEEYGIVPSLVIARKSSPGAYNFGVNHLFTFNSDNLIPLLLENGNVSTAKCKALYMYVGKALKAVMAFLDTFIRELRYDTPISSAGGANADAIYELFSDVLHFDNYRAAHRESFVLSDEERERTSQENEDVFVEKIWSRALRKFQSEGGPVLVDCPENKDLLIKALKKMWTVGRGVPSPHKPLYAQVATSLQMLDIIYLMKVARKEVISDIKSQLGQGSYLENLPRKPINHSFLPEMAKDNKLSLVAGVMIRNSSTRVFTASDMLSSEIGKEIMDIRLRGKTVGFKDVLTMLLGEDVTSEIDDSAIPPSAIEFFGESSPIPEVSSSLDLLASTIENTSTFLLMPVQAAGTSFRNFTTLGKANLRDIHLFAGIHACLVDFAYFLGANSLINREVIHGDSSFR